MSIQVPIYTRTRTGCQRCQVYVPHRHSRANSSAARNILRSSYWISSKGSVGLILGAAEGTPRRVVPHWKESIQDVAPSRCLVWLTCFCMHCRCDVLYIPAHLHTPIRAVQQCARGPGGRLSRPRTAMYNALLLWRWRSHDTRSSLPRPWKPQLLFTICPRGPSISLAMLPLC